MSSYNTFDILAVKNALPHLYLTESQARTILIAVSDQIFERGRVKGQQEAMAIVIAMVDEQGGTTKIPRLAIETSKNDGVLRRGEDMDGNVVLSTDHKENHEHATLS